MVDTKISALTAASAALGADELAINEAGTSKKLTVAQVLALAAVPSPASTVTGPDTFGASAVVGTGTTYARVDHDHGLPAAPAATVTWISLGKWGL